MKFENISGKKFGRLTAIERAGNQGRRTMWKCVCDCGNEVTVRAENLKSGNTRSCGCIEKEHHNSTTHGMSGTKLECVFSEMKQRCYNENNYEYSNYGGRGIQICDEWISDRALFYNWAISNGYSEGLSIDRIDVNGNYCPENCRWVDIYTQANNTRKNVYYEFDGQTHTLTEWSRIININSGTLYNRINRLGWTIEEALTLRPSPISQRV